jgi:hypothetical protein
MLHASLTIADLSVFTPYSKHAVDPTKHVFEFAKGLPTSYHPKLPAPPAPPTATTTSASAEPAAAAAPTAAAAPVDGSQPEVAAKRSTPSLLYMALGAAVVGVGLFAAAKYFGWNSGSLSRSNSRPASQPAPK